MALLPGWRSVVPVRPCSPRRQSCPPAFPLGRKAARRPQARTTMLLTTSAPDRTPGSTARSAHDQREDHPHRPRRLPDVRLQVADDLQPVVREERHRRRRRADGREAGGVPRVLPVAVQDEQHPRCADHHAAQGDDDRAGRRTDADRRRGRCGQRRARAGGRLAAGRPVRRRGLRPGCPAQGLRPQGEAGARRRQRRRRLADRGVPGGGRRGGMGLFDPNDAASEALGGRLVAAYPSAGGHHRLEGPGRATTSSSTPPRSA